MIIRCGLLFIIFILATSCSGNTQSTIGQNIEQQPTLLPTAIPTTNYPNVLLSATPNTEVDEPTKPYQSCDLTGGEVVVSGWSGKDTGVNYCNQCMCLTGGLACTKMACQAKNQTQ